MGHIMYREHRSGQCDKCERFIWDRVYVMRHKDWPQVLLVCRGCHDEMIKPEVDGECV